MQSKAQAYFALGRLLYYGTFEHDIVMQTWRLYFVVYPHVHAVREMILSKLNSKLVRMPAPGLEVTALCCSAPVVCSKALVVFLSLFTIIT